jgi:hypothetical protein
MAELRVGYPVLQFAVAGQQHQPLTVEIQPAGGVNSRYFDVIGQGLFATLGAELAKHLEWFMEE